MSEARDRASVATMDTPVELWSAAIQKEIAGLVHLHCASVRNETGSTQEDAATSPLGCVVAAGRQRSGRGRLGTKWADTGDEGLAVTFVVKPQAAERLAMAAAIAAAAALRSLVNHEVAARIGVKWPNDIVVARSGGPPQKLAGILVESRNERSLIGIGVNVGQTVFPAELVPRAISLRQLEQPCDRLAVLLRLTRLLDQFLSASDRVIEEAYQSLDRTAGLRMTFLTPQGAVEGVVLRCDPAIGLLVQTADGVKKLPAATTRVQG
ncbi:MAG: biotin--[acetyl-CoA-carboxylase] ligase [Planctomycetes bacterium]|nr:biotin--[acetyl-CoA-carboxylase] ligase [Planctomycetota bacterium]